MLEPGGEPGGACASSKPEETKVGTAKLGASAGMRARIGVELSAVFGVESWLPPGTVPLQHSSAFDLGRHFPLAQQAAALRVNVPAKQSKGRIRARETTSVIAM